MIKKIIKKITPPILLDFVISIKSKKYGWHGNYSSWQEAKNASIGYDADEILNKVKNSLLKVKNGEAVYERDSVLFNEIQYSWPLLSGLMFAAAKSGGKLSVLDFGGSLGSTYFQNKKFLDKLPLVSWNIVEQKHFVDAGKKDFEDERLHFYYDIESCVKEQCPNVLVLSSVLQYLEKSYIFLNKILEYGFDYVLIDRTPFSTKSKDEVKLQIVPPNIYSASYPCHFFNQQYLESYFISKRYSLIEKFNGSDGENDDYIFRGMIWCKLA
jgi:putative methyltransferase (TIGR04325 family)